MLVVWKKPFTIPCFSLSHEDPSVFIMSQWQRNPRPNAWYLAYRVLMTIFFVVVAILSIVDERNLDQPYMFRVKWLIYLTNWGFTMCTVQSLLCTIMLASRFHSARKGQASDGGPPGYLYKTYWATNTIATNSSLAITVLYWAVIFDPTKMPVDYVNVLVHGCNSGAMLLEFVMVSHPVRLGHFYISVLFGTVYSVFSAIYYYSGGTSREDLPKLYNVLDWARPLPTLAVCLGAMAFLIVIHCCSYVLYRLRKRLAELLTTRCSDEPEKTQMPVDEMFRGLDNDALATTII